MATCTAGGIESTFAKIFEEYEREVDDQLESDLVYAGESAAGEAARKSPSRGGAGKHYKSGWDYGIEKDAYGGISVIVHQKAKPSLTHLLEKGHMARDGGWVGARVHIEDAYELGVKILERRLRG